MVDNHQNKKIKIFHSKNLLFNNQVQWVQLTWSQIKVLKNNKNLLEYQVINNNHLKKLNKETVV